MHWLSIKAKAVCYDDGWEFCSALNCVLARRASISTGVSLPLISQAAISTYLRFGVSLATAGRTLMLFFPEMTTFIRKRLHWADSFDMFRKRMQEFLDLGTRAHEKLREAVVLDRVRNWKDYFGFMALQMKGHTGPTAPRVFQFVRRSGRTPLN